MMNRLLTASRVLCIGRLLTTQCPTRSVSYISHSYNVQLQHNWRTQVRSYETPQAGSRTNVTPCWNCKKVTDAKNCMICNSCGHIQDVNEDINYFELLNCPNDFNLEGQKVTQRFRQLQALVHPDKYSNKTSREQTNSADWSSLINKAYKTLLAPMERGQYMLELHGERLPEDNSALNKAFLMEMMERNEEVDEAETPDALQRLNEQIIGELNDKVQELSAQFAKSSLDKAKSILVEMKYLLSIQKTIKKKQQALM